MTLLDRPPLPAWPKHAFPGEGALAWFQRLAKVNGQVSSRTLAELLGLNGRHPRPGEFLDFCLRFPFSGREHLVDATPVVDDGLVRLGGEVFRCGVEFSFDRPRVCPACIREERFHRTWFDIQLINVCPIHGMELVRGVDGTALAWWHPEVGVTPGGVDIAKIATPPQPGPFPWEEYVLGRLGVLPRKDVALLEAATLRDIAQVCAAIGRLRLAGPPSSAGRRLEDRAALISAGFFELRQGEQGLRELFSRVAKSDHSKYGRRGRFESLRSSLARLPDSALTDAVFATLEESLHGAGVFSRNPSKRIARLPSEHLTLQDAAKRLGVKPARARQLALRLRLTETVQCPSRCYSISPAALQCIRDAVSASIDRDAAAARLEISADQLNRLVKAGHVKPLARLGGSVSRYDRYMPGDIEELRRALTR